MRRLFLVCLFVSPALGNFITSLSHAQDPAEVLEEYRLLPRFSRLLTTGHEGPNILYQLGGQYDFRHNTGWPIKANFDNAAIWAVPIWPEPAFPIAFHIEELLNVNLEDLSGEALPVMAPFDVYRFKGDASDGSSVELFAAVLGPWMYVRGDTEPPPNVNDFPTHRFHWLARSKPFADPNSDGVVDAADYVLIRRAEARGLRLGGDYDDIGFAEWSQQFGESIPDVSAFDSMMSSALASMVGTAAPEPASAVLAILAGMFVANGRRRRP